MYNKNNEDVRKFTVRVSDSELEWLKEHFNIDTFQGIINKMIQETKENSK